MNECNLHGAAKRLNREFIDGDVIATSMMGLFFFPLIGCSNVSVDSEIAFWLVETFANRTKLVELVLDVIEALVTATIIFRLFWDIFAQ